MGVKNNFSQAVSELIGISKATEPEQVKNTLNEGLSEPEIIEDTTEDHMIEEDAVKRDQLEKENDQGDQKEAGVVKAGKNPKERIMAMLAQQQESQQTQESQEVQDIQNTESDTQRVQTQDWKQSQRSSFSAAQVQSQTQQPKEPPGITTIAKGTVIIGEINAEGDVELLGSVKGKVASQGDIRANGKVIGDLTGKNIDLIACAVQGNIIASGSVTVDENSVVIGDVKGENFCLDGRIKGNVIVDNEAKFQPKAILAGNVTTTSIAMSQGAKIQGEVNIPLSEKETNISFDVDIVV